MARQSPRLSEQGLVWPLRLGLAGLILSACAASSAPPFVATALPTSAPTTAPSFPGQIAYEAEIGGTLEIIIIDADGANPRRITDNNVNDLDVAWSPDGEKIAFASERQGAYAIFIVEAACARRDRKCDEAAVRFTNHPQEMDAFEPAWSPDGSRIAYIAWADKNWEIYLARLEGGPPLRLTYNQADDMEPAWSPDGRRLAFSSYRDGNWELYVMDADCAEALAPRDGCGGNVIRLTDHPADDFEPEWSPDGKWIAWNSARAGKSYDLYENYDIYAMDTACLAGPRVCDAVGVIRLTDWEWPDTHPTWSPDGRALAYRTFRDESDQISIIDVACLYSPAGCLAAPLPHPLTRNLSFEKDPVWSPGP